MSIKFLRQQATAPLPKQTILGRFFGNTAHYANSVTVVQCLVKNMGPGRAGKSSDPANKVS